MSLHRHDRRLARRILRGDEKAFDSFFRDFFPAVFRFASGRLQGDPDLAEEIAQRTLCRVLRKLHTFRAEASLMTWTLTLCRNEIADERARRARHREVPTDELDREFAAALESLAAEDDGPEAVLGREDTARKVRAALDRLSSRHRHALEWKYLGERSVRDIAQDLAISEKAAESLLTRARLAFRDAYLILERADSTAAPGGAP